MNSLELVCWQFLFTVFVYFVLLALLALAYLYGVHCAYMSHSRVQLLPLLKFLYPTWFCQLLLSSWSAFSSWAIVICNFVNQCYFVTWTTLMCWLLKLFSVIFHLSRRVYYCRNVSLKVNVRCSFDSSAVCELNVWHFIDCHDNISVIIFSYQMTRPFIP